MWCPVAAAVLWLCWSLQAQVVLPGIKFDVLATVRSNGATLAASTIDFGTVSNVFDGQTNTLARSAGINPAFVQVSYLQARAFSRFRVLLSFGPQYEWWIEKADTQADMDSHFGTYSRITPTNIVTAGVWGDYLMPAPITAKIVRLNARRSGGDYCHFNEWEIYGEVTIDQLRIDPASAAVFHGDVVPFHATGVSSAIGESYNLDALVQWQLDAPIGTLDTNGVFVAGDSGAGHVTATASNLVSNAAQLFVAQAQSDIDVLYIERTPRIPFDPIDSTYSSGLPTNGQPMVYLAHVKNWGTNGVGLPFEWWVDGALAANGTTNVTAGARLAIPFTWTWDPADHDIEFRADPAVALREASKLNNRVRIRSNALLVGLWVEQSLYNYFHQNQLQLNDGANSFEDWGQRMVRRWNELFAKSIFPVAPSGMLDRLALDQVIVVPDGALPLAGGIAGNNPDSRDRTVDMQWGYPWSPSSTNTGAFYMFRWNGPFCIDYGSIHEMNHARFHIDLYALDANHNASEPNIQLTDDTTGQLVVGTPKMPFIAFDVAYYNKWRDIMGAGPPVFDAYSAAVWNWKHHRRGQGNQNTPPDVGRFMTDVPRSNHVHFIDQNGVPLAGATVSVYQGSGFYSEYFDNTADIVQAADDRGTIHLGQNPFGGLGGYSSGPDLIFKVRYSNELYFAFQEITDFNLENWMRAGPRQEAADGFYFREIDLRNKAVAVPTNSWLGNYFNGEELDSFVGSRVEGDTNGLFFAVDGAAPIKGANAEHFSVYWNGNIPFTDGWKQFNITADGGVRLYINHRLVFDAWTNNSLQTWQPVIYTVRSAPFVNPGRPITYGAHQRVEVRYRHSTGPARLELRWNDEVPAPVVPVNLWGADYYSTRTLEGYLVSRVETTIDNDYGSGSPDPVVPSGNFSARWTGDWDFPGGNVNFRALTDDGMRAWIDDVPVLDAWIEQPPTTYTFSRNMTAGRHRLRIEYFQAAGTARALFTWSMPPRIISGPSNQTVFAGATLMLSAEAAGIPAPTFQWQINGTNLAGATAATLVLSNLQPAQAGTYTVVVSNLAGSITTKGAVVSVVPPPAAVTLESPRWITNGSFAFDLRGTSPSNRYAIQGTTNLLQWQVLTNVVFSSNPPTFVDPGANARPLRFYRVESQ